ncbi:hypothetical protein B0A55_08829 [Friedmanniomyces simplex]|uniref:Uncharacterized protein n=1 Tax=Friedmanniomyces simplex TaxID=329884 RepID=A0A4U0X2J5_9PEZI|nr:hypothetical protein B0A55_08829 [Friedmanniomyces simplex]
MPSQHTKPRARKVFVPKRWPHNPRVPVGGIYGPLLTDEELDRMVDAAKAKEAAEAEEAWLAQVDPDFRAKYKASSGNQGDRRSQNHRGSTEPELVREQAYEDRAVGGYQAGGGFLTEEAYTAACPPETRAAHGQVRDAVNQAEKEQPSSAPIPDYHPIFAALKGSVFETQPTPPPAASGAPSASALAASISAQPTTPYQRSALRNRQR